ncbi:Beta-galactosidase [Mariniphaga anaerophila]|uniref:Beta-galactosidase n=2 Tax=Mariniphaga anaerophila TaxID=1484053 RepID=A0A1M5EEM1_9BACT|nr:Beta-galactosidase [Mariniphaga anaerophila]
MKRRNFVKKMSTGGGALFTGMNLLGMEKEGFEGNIRRNLVREGNIGKSSTSCHLKQYMGKPTVFINDEPCFPTAYLSHFPQQFRYKNMYEHGTKIFGCYVSLGDRFPGFYKNQKVRLNKHNIWIAPGKIDFDIMDASINEILEVAPDAYILPRISCNSPSWWDSFHPADTCRTYETGLPQCQSFSSQIWREETAEVLRKIVQHVYRSTYADRFIGMHICVGETNESVHLGWLGDTDYSIVAEARFKEWLLQKYNNDRELIQNYFGKSIEQISIPLPVEREKPEFGNFFDPEKSRLNIDYRFFRCDEIIDSIEFLCRAVKEESHGNLLTGTFYGHTFTQWLDHMNFSRFLKSPYVDFFTSTTFRTEIDSIKKANKLFYNEGDEKTCLGKWISEMRPEIDPYHVYDLPIWKRPGTLDQTLEHLKSEFTHAICTGTTLYWYDLWGGWYDHERILKFFSEAQKVADESIHKSGDSLAEVCVIVDEKSIPYFAPLKRQRVSNIPWLNYQKAQIDKIGTPYDIYLLEDLKNLDISGYKMMIFFNSFVLSSQDRDLISRKCMSGGRTLLWLYAPGLIGDKISVDNVSSLVGMQLGYEDKKEASDIIIDLPTGKLKYKGSAASPFIYIKSGGASNIYGHTNDGFAIFGENRMKDYSNILACYPTLPWQAIQHFALEAGVNIYNNNGDVLYCNQSYLSIKASSPGKKIISLPFQASLIELMVPNKGYGSGERITLKPDKTFEIEFSSSGETRFFRFDN